MLDLFAFWTNTTIMVIPVLICWSVIVISFFDWRIDCITDGKHEKFLYSRIPGMQSADKWMCQNDGLGFIVFLICVAMGIGLPITAFVIDQSMVHIIASAAEWSAPYTAWLDIVLVTWFGIEVILKRLISLIDRIENLENK